MISSNVNQFAPSVFILARIPGLAAATVAYSKPVTITRVNVMLAIRLFTVPSLLPIVGRNNEEQENGYG